jgi:predicted YcjX-like family ATPase
VVRQRRIRVGVIGMYRSGKTVLLTSLINHLLNHHPDRLTLGDGQVELGCLKSDLPPADAGFAKFEYGYYRSRLGNRVWPDKTLACSQYRCRLLVKRSEKRHEQIELTLTDMAGERLADLSMADQTYEQWSDSILELFGHLEYQSAAGEYLALAERPGVSADAVVATYRRVLARLIHSFLPLVSPSAFLVDANSKHCDVLDVDSLAATRLSGLDEARQFATLPKPVRERDVETVARFRQHYREYRRQIVEPLAHWFTQCETLLVVTDLTMLLAGGVGMYNGQKQMLSQVVDYLAPGRGPFNRWADRIVRTGSWGRFSAGDLLKLTSAGRLRMSGVRRVAFVATKADKIHVDDHDKLLGLLHDMTRNLAVQGRFTGGLKVEEFVCAAVKSSVSLPEYPFLDARLTTASQNGEADLQRFETAQVPEHWPDKWAAGDFVFPDVFPLMPSNRDLPPRHIGLDRVVNYVLAGQ